jgi:hypothetical protein
MQTLGPSIIACIYCTSHQFLRGGCEKVSHVTFCFEEFALQTQRRLKACMGDCVQQVKPVIQSINAVPRKRTLRTAIACWPDGKWGRASSRYAVNFEPLKRSVGDTNGGESRGVCSDASSDIIIVCRCIAFTFKNIVLQMSSPIPYSRLVHISPLQLASVVFQAVGRTQNTFHANSSARHLAMLL